MVFLLDADERTWSRSATPRFHGCELSSHRKVALRSAAGTSHLHEWRFKTFKRSQNKRPTLGQSLILVRMRGLEPPRACAH
ncbi:MAG: hypothetical protein JWP13_876 [Candidatus Saccharibacteria bacterium]|nr:hypothetical protein [Candidatus Saccharibacteria bacterium]